MKRSPIKRRGKRTKKSKGHLFPKLVDETYRAWIRSQPCLLAQSHQCGGRVQVCHVKSRGAGGADHGNIVPICAAGHLQQHRMGLQTFQFWWEMDLAKEAVACFEMYKRDYLTPFEGL